MQKVLGKVKVVFLVGDEIQVLVVVVVVVQMFVEPICRCHKLSQETAKVM